MIVRLPLDARPRRAYPAGRMYPKRQEDYVSGWFVLGAVSLAGLAGFTNSAALQLGSLAVSHLTGSITRVSVELAEGDTRTMVPFTVVLLAFFFGAVLSGAVVSQKELGFGRRYGALLVLEAGLLAMAASLALPPTRMASLALAAFACGMQNALASSYRGMVVRTTHMTGVVTDLGFEMGVWLRTRRIRVQLLKLQVPVLLAFLVGGALGALTAMRVGSEALYVAAFVAFVSGVGYLGLHARKMV